jgi:hypothetical protein
MTTPELAKDTFISSDPLQAAQDALNGYAAAGRAVGYRQLALVLGLRPPQQIQKVATLLEAIQRIDAEANRPQRAALVIQKGDVAIPRRGFFQQLLALGLYNGAFEGPEAIAWHQTELARLFAEHRCES